MVDTILLLQKIKYTPKHNNYRRKISSYYDVELAFTDNIKLTSTDPGSSRHLYVIRVKDRDKLAKYLIKNNIPVQFHYPYSLNKTRALSRKVKRVKLLNSEKWARECISLPLHPYMSINDAKRTVNFIKKYFHY